MAIQNHQPRFTDTADQGPPINNADRLYRATSALSRAVDGGVQTDQGMKLVQAMRECTSGPVLILTDGSQVDAFTAYARGVSPDALVRTAPPAAAEPLPNYLVLDAKNAISLAIAMGSRRFGGALVLTSRNYLGENQPGADLLCQCADYSVLYQGQGSGFVLRTSKSAVPAGLTPDEPELDGGLTM